MTSTFLGLEIGKRGLDLHQRSLQVTGQNLTNADNEAYSRQRVNIRSMPALTDPSLNREERPGQLGQGAEIASIRRDRDSLIEGRIHSETGSRAYWHGVHDLTTQAENVHNSLGDDNIPARLDRFWSGWQDLSKNPSEPAVRAALVETAVGLARGLNQTHGGFTALRHEIDARVEGEVRVINTLAAGIADLNKRIAQSLSAGDQPNDLMDERDRLVGELAEKVDVKVTDKDPDEYMVHIGGRILIQGGQVAHLMTEKNPDDEGMARVFWESDRDGLKLSSGRLKAWLEGRDQQLPDQIRRVNALAVNLGQAVNEVHRQSFDLYGRRGGNFFVERPAAADIYGNIDTNRDGIEDGTAIFQVEGSQRVNPDALVGATGTLRLADRRGLPVEVVYRAGDRLKDVLDRVNLAEANVNMSVNSDGHLIVKANSEAGRDDFRIRHLEDSGSFLVGLTGILRATGEAGAFDQGRVNEIQKLNSETNSVRLMPQKDAASWIAVAPTVVEDAGKVAAADGVDTQGRGKDRSRGPGDGSRALTMAGIRHEAIQIDGKRTLNEHTTSMIEILASRGKSAKIEADKSDTIHSHLDALRKSISGVSIDEEMTRMLAFQAGYKAAARVVSVMDEMLDTIITRMT